MKKLLFLFPIFIFQYSILSAQSLSPQVNAAAGNYYSGKNAKLQWTIGEVVTETFSNNNNKLTQGFYQTKITITDISELPIINYQLSIYPNPTSSAITIETDGLKEKTFVELYDMNGKTLHSETLISSLSGRSGGAINLENYSTGNYLLLLKSTNNKTIKSFKISKQ